MPVNIGDPKELESRSSKEIPDQGSHENMLTDADITSDTNGASSKTGNNYGPEETVNGSESTRSECLSDRGSSSTRESTPASCAVVTENMLQEEERLKQEQKTEREEEDNKEVQNLSGLAETQRFSRLQYLLEKSSIYSKLLLKRMESQREEKKSRKARKVWLV